LETITSEHLSIRGCPYRWRSLISSISLSVNLDNLECVITRLVIQSSLRDASIQCGIVMTMLVIQRGASSQKDLHPNPNSISTDRRLSTHQRVQPLHAHTLSLSITFSCSSPPQLPSAMAGMVVYYSSLCLWIFYSGCCHGRCKVQ